MTIQQDVTIQLSDQIRLISAVLSITDWPQKAQERQPHGTHAHARATRKFLEPMKAHPAVQGMQHILDQGAPMEALFDFALRMTWPGLEIEQMPTWAPLGWNALLRDFYSQSGLEKLWKNEEFQWQAALAQAERAFREVSYKPTLKPFFGEVQQELVFVPNITYPSESEVTLLFDNRIICISPPRLAWGDSPPWPFDEDPAYIRRVALSQYCKILMIDYLRHHAEKVAQASETPLPVSDQFRARYPTWQEQFTNLYIGAISAIYLEERVSKSEANAYVLMERKAAGKTTLPGMISVLKRYLNDYNSGRYKEFGDFLPLLPKQLKVAAKIVGL